MHHALCNLLEAMDVALSWHRMLCDVRLTRSPFWHVHMQAAQALEPAALIAILLLKPSGKVAIYPNAFTSACGPSSFTISDANSANI